MATLKTVFGTRISSYAC